MDVSSNLPLQESLLKFLSTKYNFKGYEDNEKQIFNQIKVSKGKRPTSPFLSNTQSTKPKLQPKS
jgi:hypothetical protein